MGSIADNLSKSINKAFTELRVDNYDDKFSDMGKMQAQVVGEEDENEEEVEEATGAGSAGGYSAPLFSKETNEVKKNNLFQTGTESKLEKLKEEDEILVGGLGDDMNIADIAKLHGVDTDVIIDELEMGLDVEMEHTSDIIVSLEIALDHLTEDPHYYTKLKTIEEDGVEIEANEATTTASSGQYSSPLFLAKDSKNWRGGSKPLYKGGKFVGVKNRCRTFPYCNSGEIDSWNLFEDGNMKKAISSVSKKMNIEESVIKTIIFSEIQEMVNK